MYIISAISSAWCQESAATYFPVINLNCKAKYVGELGRAASIYILNMCAGTERYFSLSATNSKIVGVVLFSYFQI